MPHLLRKDQLWSFTKIRALLVLAALSCLIACSDPDTPEFGILVKNDIRDKTHNVIRVDEIRTKNAQKWLSFNLSPGGRRHIKFHNITGLRFSRRYPTHTQYYEVECPGGLSKGVVMKLIDVHLGRIAGGCKTVRSFKG